MLDGLILIAVGVGLLALAPNLLGEQRDLQTRVLRFSYPRLRGAEKLGSVLAYGTVAVGVLLGVAAIVGGVVLIFRA